MSPTPTPDTLAPRVRGFTAPWALLLQVLRRWRLRQLAQPYKRLAYARCATTSSAERPPLRPGKLTTMTITPTRRCWLASGRLLLAVLLISLGGTALLCLSGAESSLVMCMASTP